MRPLIDLTHDGAINYYIRYSMFSGYGYLLVVYYSTHSNKDFTSLSISVLYFCISSKIICGGFLDNLPESVLCEALSESINNR